MHRKQSCRELSSVQCLLALHIRWSMEPGAAAAAAASRSVSASGSGRLIAVGNDTACHHQAPDQEQSSRTDLTEQRLWTISGASLPGHRKPPLIREICSNFFDDSTSDSS